MQFLFLAATLQDVVNCHNDTPLHEACAAGHTEVARALIEARAAIDVAGRRRLIRLDMAQTQSRVSANGLNSTGTSTHTHRDTRTHTHMHTHTRMQTFDLPRSISLSV